MTVSVYPRRYRLGLIEAISRISDWLAREVRGIRGVIASASLKRVMDFPPGLDRYEYPRRYRLGLIEAAEHPSPSSALEGVSEALSPRPH